MDTLVVLARSEGITEELRRALAQLPQAIAQAEAQVQTARDTVTACKAQLDESEKRRRSHESDLKDAEAKRAKFQAQTSAVKTNQEYTALLHEIDGLGTKISELETAILEAMEAIDTARSTLKATEVEQRKLEQVAVGQVGQLRERLAQVESDLKVREAERAQLAGALPADLRVRYERVRVGKGSGTAQFSGRVCGKCHREIPYEIINRIGAGEAHPCGNCTRILVPADPPPSDAPPAS